MTAVKLDRHYIPWLACLAAIAVAAFALFGFTGFRTIIAIVALFIVPPLLLLRKSGLDFEEKIFFSLFVGIGLFSLLAWSVNQVLPSFRASAVAALALIAVAGFFAPRILQRAQKKSQ